MFDSLQL